MENNYDFIENIPAQSEQYTMSAGTEDHHRIDSLYLNTIKKSNLKLFTLLAAANIIFIPFDTTAALSIFFFGVLYALISLSRYKKIEKELKKNYNSIGNKYQILDIYDEKLAVSVFENNELTNKYTVTYDDIYYFNEDEDYFLFSDKTHLFYAKKADISSDSILYNKFNVIADKLQKNKKSLSTAAALILISAYLGLFAMCAADELSLVFGNPCDWAQLLVLPFSIASVIYSVILKKKQLKYIPNLIIGILFTISALTNAANIFGYEKYYNSGYNIISETEKIIGTEIPTPDYIKFYDYSYYEEDSRIEIINEVYIELTDQEYVETDINYVEKIVTAASWVKGLPDDFADVIPYPDYFTDSEYTVLYNVDTGEMNTVPEESGKHRLAIIAYYYGIIDIVEFYITT